MRLIAIALLFIAMKLIKRVRCRTLCQLAALKTARAHDALAPVESRRSRRSPPWSLSQSCALRCGSIQNSDSISLVKRLGSIDCCCHRWDFDLLQAPKAQSLFLCVCVMWCRTTGRWSWSRWWRARRCRGRMCSTCSASVWGDLWRPRPTST